MGNAADDLIGTPAVTKPKATKPAAKAPAKVPAKAAAKPAAKAPAKAAAKPAKKTAAVRSDRGQGKYYFPKDGKERTQLTAGIVKRVTAPITTKEFAAKYKLPTWKVRLAAADAVEAKQLKMARSGENGGAMVMSPKK